MFRYKTMPSYLCSMARGAITAE